VREGDRSRAWELAHGVQERRYTRFIEQVGGVADALVLGIDELEGQTALAIRREIAASLAVTGAVFGAVLIAVLLISRNVTRPILTAVTFAQLVARGNLSGTLGASSRDETGDLARALNAMVSGLSTMVRRVTQSSRELTGISQRIFAASKQVVDAARLQAKGIADTSSAVRGINVTARQVAEEIDSLSESSSENATSILEMAETIDDVAQTVESLSESVEEVGTAVSETTESIKQISSSAGILMEAAGATASSVTVMDTEIRQIEKTATTSASLVEQVRGDAELGQLSVEATIAGTIEIRRSARVTSEVMRSLSGKIENIGAILSVIDDILDQTSLLALNAAIIAAQAGDRGRGFAVVAAEIGALAERTGSSTGEIATVIEAVQDEARRAVESIEQGETAIAEGERLSQESGEALKKIVAGVGTTTDQMDEIVKATKGQTQQSQQIKVAMDKISAMVDQIASATQEQGRGSDFIMKALVQMNELTLHARSRTQGQSSAGRHMAQAAEDTAAMIERIKKACDEQSRASEQIVRAVGNIESSTAVNLETTAVMDSAVSGLAKQIRVLDEEMECFELEPKSPSGS